MIAAMTPPATAEVSGFGIGSDPASGRADTGDHEAGRGSIRPSSSQAVQVPASSSQAWQWAAGDIYFQQEHAQQWLDEEFGEQETRQWQDRCYICAIGGRDEGGTTSMI
jgi:hypothetical protein